MGELWKNQDEKMDIENEKEPDVNKKKIVTPTFALHTHAIFILLSTVSSTKYKYKLTSLG